MPLIAIGSAKASPGVTTLALALAIADPGRRTIVVEADGDGGSIAARLGLGYEPGLVELAAAARRDSPPIETIERYLQPIASEVSVLCGPASPAQANAALGLASSSLATSLAAASVDAVVDLGRITARGVNLDLARRSHVTLLLARPTLDEIQHLAPSVDLLTRAGAHVELVTLGHRPYDPQEVADHLGIRLFGAWVDDRTAATAFWARPMSRSRAEARSLWWRATADLRQHLDVRMASGAAGDVRLSAEPSPARTAEPA